MPATTLLSLSDELLAHICSYAMTHQPPPPITKTTSYLQHPPPGLISEQISKTLRGLLTPFRCCSRLYRIAKHQFLESNIILLHLSDIRGSASRLEFTSGTSQMIMTGNPEPLLRNLVHVELVVSISDMRAPFSQPFASRISGKLWKSGNDVLSLNKEAENLKRLAVLCPNLRTLHVCLKVDEWVLYGRGPQLKRKTAEEVEGGNANDAGSRYLRLAEVIVELAREAEVKFVTVSFNHWRSSAQAVDVREKSAEEVMDACLGSSLHETWFGPVARIK
ncbi:hypothetical protein CKM354_001291300 [Cercospora kikuchii]|uniref:F-box domain-containing protein n=1 Tax=Cercospora kikuchii TaxID=84275 RepID=A0A9P3FMX9_9PEZI|nr:uncharacterized protein CKM354_001291300 [Cercospora kikuchii]GIZ49896.1 hypothetical protein CKM354_001291300 [Cercospora kikuchii]